LSNQLQITSKKGEKSPSDETSNDKIAKYFPSFLGVVRDFALKLQDTQGN
jgi:hypothetical protein